MMRQMSVCLFIFCFILISWFLVQTTLEKTLGRTKRISLQQRSTKQTSALTDTLILDKILNPSFTIGRLRCQLVSRSSVAATKCWIVFFLHCSGDTGCRRLLTARHRLDSRQKTLIFFPLSRPIITTPPFLLCLAPAFFSLLFFF